MSTFTTAVAFVLIVQWISVGTISYPSTLELTSDYAPEVDLNPDYSPEATEYDSERTYLDLVDHRLVTYPRYTAEIEDIKKFLLEPLEKDFQDISNSIGNLTRTQYNQKLLEWAQKYGLKERMEKFFKEKAAKTAETRNRTLENLKKLPELYKKYLEIQDDNKPTGQVEEEMSSFIDSHLKYFNVIRSVELEVDNRHPEDEPMID